jgi:hypothetical protein
VAIREGQRHRGHVIVDRREFLTLAAWGAVGATLPFPEFQTAPGVSHLVHAGPDGRLVYVGDALGNVIPDFSNAGYGGGGVAIPEAAVVTDIGAESGDATARIQDAIDRVSQLPLQANGTRGAILLRKGRHLIGGSLNIATGGVVLRGEGSGASETVLVAAGKSDRSLINIGGTDEIHRHSSRDVLDPYVPVGAHKLRIERTDGLKVGDEVLVVREGNDAWIHEIGMDHILRRPGDPDRTNDWSSFNLSFERVITAIDGNVVEVDGPITCAIDAKWGGGELRAYEKPGRITNVGIENLRGESEFDSSIKAELDEQRYSSDENHASTFISIDHSQNVWVRGVSALHFSYACVSVEKDTKWITVEDCDCREMVSEITGSRRYAFNVAGQLVLVQRCAADSARHSFVVGPRACGPNVFLDCVATTQFATSEPHHHWSVGGLYDNVHADIAIQDREWMGSGHGWAGANYVAWNCEGSLVCQKPPTAQNYAIGQVGLRGKGAFDRPDGYWESFGNHVTPQSLYRKQLEDRRRA